MGRLYGEVPRESRSVAENLRNRIYSAANSRVRELCALGTIAGIDLPTRVLRLETVV